MLDAQVYALLDITVLNLLVDDNSDGALGNVVHNTGLSVVNLVWHTICELGIYSCPLRPFRPILLPGCQCHSPLLNGTVGLDIHDVSDFVLSQVCGQLDHTLARILVFQRFIYRAVESHLLLEITAERIARASSETSWMTHFDGVTEGIVVGFVVVVAVAGTVGDAVSRIHKTLWVGENPGP